MIHPDLRPLGIGEILDRAVTVFVRRFAVLVLILALVAIPVAICQYVAQPQMSGMLDILGRVLALPPGHAQEQRALLAQFFGQNRVGGVGLAIITAAVVLGALSTTACVIAVAESYAGMLPSVREVYRKALRRWPAQLVALAFYFTLAFALMVGVVIIVFFIALAIGALAAVSTPLATVAGIPAVLVGLLVSFGIIALLYFAAQMTLISIALEDSNPIRGIAQGLRRTFSPPIFRRSVLVATIVLVVSAAGQLLLVTLAGALSVLTHVTALYLIVAVVGGIVLNALVTTFIVIYTYDVRVRREGFDLVLAAQAQAL